MSAAAISSQLIELLRCPVTHAPLRLEGTELVSTADGRRYPIRDGIPVLLPETAVTTNSNEVTAPAGENS